MTPLFDIENSEPEQIHDYFSNSSKANKTVPFTLKGKALGTYTLR